MKKITQITITLILSSYCSNLQKTNIALEELNPKLRQIISDEVTLIESEENPKVTGSLIFYTDQNIKWNKIETIPHTSENCKSWKWNIPTSSLKKSEINAIELNCLTTNNEEESYFLYFDLNTGDQTSLVKKGHLIAATSPRYKNKLFNPLVQKYEGDAIFYTLNPFQASQASKIHDQKLAEENKIFIEDNETIKSLTLNLDEFKISENDTELQESDKTKRKNQYIEKFIAKNKGKHIKFNSLTLIDIKVEKELSSKGKKINQEMKNIGVKYILKTATESDISKYEKLSQDIASEYTGNEIYTAEFHISNSNKLLERSKDDLYIYKQLTKSKAINMEKGKDYKVEGKIQEIIYTYINYNETDKLWKIVLK